MPRKKNYKAELARYDIHMKDGREKFLLDVARYYVAMYPDRADFFKENLRRLREMNKNSDGSYRTPAGEFHIRYRIPTELLMFIQRWVPEFGQESDDIDLLVRVWCDLVRVGKDRRVRTRLVIPNNWSTRRREPESDSCDEAGLCPRCRGTRLDPDGGTVGTCLCDDHRQEQPGAPRPVPPLAPEKFHPRG